MIGQANKKDVQYNEALVKIINHTHMIQQQVKSLTYSLMCTIFSSLFPPPHMTPHLHHSLGSFFPPRLPPNTNKTFQINMFNHIIIFLAFWISGSYPLIHTEYTLIVHLAQSIWYFHVCCVVVYAMAPISCIHFGFLPHTSWWRHLR